jgi:protein TonB
MIVWPQNVCLVLALAIFLATGGRSVASDDEHKLAPIILNAYSSCDRTIALTDWTPSRATDAKPRPLSEDANVFVYVTVDSTGHVIAAELCRKSADPANDAAAVAYTIGKRPSLSVEVFRRPKAERRQFAVRVWMPTLPEDCGAATAASMTMTTSQPETPADAKRLGLRGRVGVLIQVAADGTPQSPTIESSSGHESMDRAAINAAMESRFWPATKDCRPVPSSYLFIVEFNSS